jgi:hypothetical protein
MFETFMPQMLRPALTRQQRTLDRIDKTLAADDPRLGSMFAIFTTLSLGEPMPETERVSARLKQVLRPAMVISIALIAGLTVLLFSTPVHARNRCSFTLADSRLAQAWSRTRNCLPGPANPLDRLFLHSGK